MTGIHRDTIMRLLVEVGSGCSALMDTHMRDLSCERLQVDEIWTYVQKKQRHVAAEDDASRVGDFWTFVALDADTKLIPVYRIGKRDLPTAKAFMGDLADRLSNRVQLSSEPGRKESQQFQNVVPDIFGLEASELASLVAKRFHGKPPLTGFGVHRRSGGGRVQAFAIIRFLFGRALRRLARLCGRDRSGLRRRCRLRANRQSLRG